jgi:hypothetical protein
VKNSPLKSARTALWYGVPATGAGKFGVALSGLLWPHIRFIADTFNEFGILQLAGLPESVQIDQTWLASICAVAGAVGMSFVMSQIKFYWRKYIGGGLNA